MHEHHAVQHLVNEVIKTANDNNAKTVKTVSISVGKLTGFKQEWIENYYNQFAKGTIAQGAKLEVNFEGSGKEFFIKNIEIVN
jgi:hydrogenase nickel incorporation protein HypA/HybF